MIRAKVMTGLTAALALSACTLHSGNPTTATHGRITLDEPDHFFYPRTHPPSGVMTPQDAYTDLVHALGHPSKPLPSNVTARYGLLSQNNTSPPSDRTPVWAFTVRITCMISSGGHTKAGEPDLKCVFWTFVRASDGRYLEVGDQQVIS